MSIGAVNGFPEASFVATVAIGQYLPVNIDTTANKVVVCDANTDESIGFTINETTEANEPVAVRVAGFSLAIVGAAGWSKGDKLTPATVTTAGELITTTTAAHKVCAIAMEAATSTEKGLVQIISPSLRYDSF